MYDPLKGIWDHVTTSAPSAAFSRLKPLTGGSTSLNGAWSQAMPGTAQPTSSSNGRNSWRFSDYASPPLTVGDAQLTGPGATYATNPAQYKSHPDAYTSHPDAYGQTYSTSAAPMPQKQVAAMQRRFGWGSAYDMDEDQEDEY